jgi:protein-S-isoprenylcysteine O-methyltransferase Ste14
VTLLLKNLVFTFLVPGTVAVYVPLRLAATQSAATGIRFALALMVLAVGAAIYAWCVWDFATFGRGTPAPIDAPKRLVVRGLYRYTRNPMYLGVLTVISGWALMFSSPRLVAYALFVALCFNLFVVFYEEPTLRRLFPSDYEDYCARVGRWLPRRSAEIR